MNEEIKRLKRFGYVLSSVWAALSLFLVLRNPESRVLPVSVVLSLSALLLTLFSPRNLVYPERFLMKVAETVGWLNTRIVLVLLFYLVFTPMAVLMRWIGKKTLDTDIDPNKTSYWEQYEFASGPERYERQF